MFNLSEDFTVVIVLSATAVYLFISNLITISKLLFYDLNQKTIPVVGIKL